MSEVVEISEYNTAREMFARLKAAYCKPSCNATLEAVRNFLEFSVDFDHLEEPSKVVKAYLSLLENGKVTSVKDLVVWEMLAKLSTRMQYVDRLRIIGDENIETELLNLFASEKSRLNLDSPMPSLNAFSSRVPFGDPPRKKNTRTQCSHCGKSGHSVDTCWIKHPEKKSNRFKKRIEEKSIEDTKKDLSNPFTITSTLTNSTLARLICYILQI